MFTGIVEAVGTVLSLDGPRLRVALPPDSAGSAEVWASEPIKPGESVAVNGCCLTAIDRTLTFELSEETFNRTSLGALKAGSRVNLERAMRADGRFGGHIVQGHVDATGTVVGRRSSGNAEVFTLALAPDLARFVMDKGSVTVDGISLTVVDPSADRFDLWIIPHTLTHTNLGDRQPGDRVNLEFDVLAKYVERLLSARPDSLTAEAPPHATAG